MGCCVSKEKPEESAASATSHLPPAAHRCNISNTMCTFSADITGIREEKKKRDRRFWRKCVAKDQKEAKPALIEKNKIVSDKKYCKVYNGASLSFGVYCRRSASVSSSRATNEGNSSDKARETKSQMEGPLNSDQRSEAELAGKKERKRRGFMSRPAGVASLLNVSWRNPLGRHHKLVEKVTP